MLWPVALRLWATSVYWTGKAVGVLVVGVTVRERAENGRGHEFVVDDDHPRRWPRLHAWNAACLTAVAYRVRTETWPMTSRAAHTSHATCYDTVCGGPWCVYACVYYAVAWLDRTSEMAALLAAATWRRRSTAKCLNLAVAVAECLDDDDKRRRPCSSAADVPWHAYLTVAFPVVHFAANAISPTGRAAEYGVWRAATATVAAVASCAPVAAHGTAVALLVVANNEMRSINRRVTRLSPTGRRRRLSVGHQRLRQTTTTAAVVSRLARRHWAATELVTGGVCDAYAADLLAAVLLAAVRVTYVAASVFHRLTGGGDDANTQSLQWTAVVTQLIAWFGQFAYLAYTCDELAAQSSELFDNLNSLLLDIFKECRLSGETYSSRTHEIETVQEFMRQVVARRVVVHACCGLITLNLSLITTIIGVTMTYLIVLLQFESSYHDGNRNDTIHKYINQPIR